MFDILPLPVCLQACPIVFLFQGVALSHIFCPLLTFAFIGIHCRVGWACDVPVSDLASVVHWLTIYAVMFAQFSTLVLVRFK